MAQHAHLRIDTGLAVYFCDPHSPWQRGTNENTNGLLRQYFPKGADLSRRSQDDLASVAASLNSHPRKGLSWKTPAEVLDAAPGAAAADQFGLPYLFTLVRAGLQGFVAEGQQLLAGYLTARVAAGELREHDTRAAAQLLLSTVALGHVTGAGVDPGAVVDVLLHGLTATPRDAAEQGGR
jgi:hypothetical protein